MSSEASGIADGRRPRSVKHMFDPRRLAAMDMYGLHGSVRRGRIIRAEFVAGAALCTALGVISLLSRAGSWRWVGVWLVGVGANYIVLASHAHALSRPGALEVQVRGLDISRELRRVGLTQLWIAVPFAVCISALTNSGRGRRG